VEAAARVVQKRVMKYLGVWYQSGEMVNSKQLHCFLRGG
jgi:hypothetical protein